ncbi:28S ribosomal protein S7, mitochondrial-like isoform X2 [Macrosteles quadrilineatus]|uniref:28S ribosomal protein S7, mitochondrial-like isoform X2 n=1 Tax=Macrosteles quadrilineatus TaxID=74068 RepID=UPI0023E1AB05|nr:28S ribosomal protein S7, mitochondrial-like isoform X2 [Macrosteles quadrilineatus]
MNSRIVRKSTKLLKLSFLTPGNLLLTPVRHKIFSPSYVAPIVSREKIKQLQETGEISKLAHVPILPATNTENISVYNDPIVQKFTNYLMREGKKLRAQILMLKCFERIKRIQVKRYHKQEDPVERAKIEVDPLKIFHAAVENCKPLLQLTAVKRGGATYQVPKPITPNRASFLAMNWLIEAGRDKDRSILWSDQMAQELINAASNKGRVIKKKQDLHKNCEANRAYAHYRWG